MGKHVRPLLCLAGSIATCVLLAAIAMAQTFAAQIGREKGVPVHLQDGQEQQVLLRALIAFGDRKSVV